MVGTDPTYLKRWPRKIELTTQVRLPNFLGCPTSHNVGQSQTMGTPILPPCRTVSERDRNAVARSDHRDHPRHHTQMVGGLAR